MNEQEKRDEHKTKSEIVVRWDKYRIVQFSYTNNLLTGLNLAFLSFFITQSNFNLSYKCHFLILQVFSLLLLIASFITGFCIVFNRLQDFRKTAQLTKLRKKKFEHDHHIITYSDIYTINSDILDLEKETNKLGIRTWHLLNWQIWTFLIGTIIGILYIIIEKNISV